MSVLHLSGTSQIVLSRLLLLFVEICLIFFFFDIHFFENKKMNTITYKLVLALFLYSAVSYVQIFIYPFNLFNRFLAMTIRVQLSVFTDVMFIGGVIWLICQQLLKLRIFQSIFWISMLLLSISSTNAFVDVVFQYMSMKLGTLPWLLYIINPLFRSLVSSLFLSLVIFSIKKGLQPVFVREQKQRIAVQIALIGISILSNFVLIYFTRDLLYPNILSYRVISFIIIVIILINIFVLVLYKGQENYYKSLNQLELEKKMFEAQLKQVDLMKESQEKIAGIKHDLKNEHLVLLSLLESDEVRQAIILLKAKLASVENTDNFYTNNAILNFFLNEKNEYAMENRINFKAKVLIPEKSIIENEILVGVIGNLLDNAFSAILRNKLCKNEVKLMIKTFNDKLLIEVKNHFDIAELESRKTRNEEGYGLKNIQRVVSEQGGIYKQWTDGDIFYTSIIFFNI